MTWDANATSIISTSDDRSAKIWQDIWNSPVCTTLYGHTARVWKSRWIGEVQWCHQEVGNEPHRAQLVLTCSEDMTCRLWNVTTSECVGIYHGHTGKNVWGICADSTRHMAVSTGADGAVKVITISTSCLCSLWY